MYITFTYPEILAKISSPNDRIGFLDPFRTPQVDEDDKTATHVPRRQARQYDHSPRMKKRASPIHGEAVEKDAPAG